MMAPGLKAIPWRPHRSQKGRKPPISQAKWCKYRDLIYEKYIVQKKTSNAVLDVLAKLGFHPSRRQLAAQLRKWNIRKNRISGTASGSKTQPNDRSSGNRSYRMLDQIIEGGQDSIIQSNQSSMLPDGIQSIPHVHDDLPAQDQTDISLYMFQQTSFPPMDPQFSSGTNTSSSQLTSHNDITDSSESPFEHSCTPPVHGMANGTTAHDHFDYSMLVEREGLPWFRMRS